MIGLNFIQTEKDTYNLVGCTKTIDGDDERNKKHFETPFSNLFEQNEFDIGDQAYYDKLYDMATIVDGDTDGDGVLIYNRKAIDDLQKYFAGEGLVIAITIIGGSREATVTMVTVDEYIL